MPCNISRDFEPAQKSFATTKAMICLSLAIAASLYATDAVNSQDTTSKAVKNSKSRGEEPRIDRLIRELYRVKTASGVVRLIDEALATNKWTDKEIERLKSQRDRFVELDRKQLVKLGTNWVSPAERASAIERSGIELATAKEDLKKLDGRSAIRRLEKASDLNPDGFEADFFLAMLFSVKGNCNPILAQKHFERVLDRTGEFVPALNNLALTEVKLQNYEQALRYWQHAASIDPRNTAVRHNVARVVQEANRKTLPVPNQRTPNSKAKTRLDMFVDLRDKLDASGKSSEPSLRTRTGWLYLPLASAESPPGVTDERPRTVVPNDTALASTQPVSSALLPVLTSTGTGFAVGKNHILTNRHVVDSELFGQAIEVRVQCIAGKETERLTGRITAISDADDLALIEVPGLQATPLFPSPESISRGTDIAVLGYPQTHALGTTLKMTRGIISSVPTKDLSGMFVLDAEANPGNSGGPVCDAHGQLLGVVTAVTREHIGNYTLAIPSANARNFVGLQKIEWSPQDEKPAIKEWREVDQQVSPSVFFIETYHNAKPLQLAEYLPKQIRPVRQELEDMSCCMCNGVGSVRCRAKGCALGSVTSLEWYQSTVDAGIYGKVGIAGTTAKQSRCDSCNGTGRLRCPACKGDGVSSDIR